MKYQGDKTRRCRFLQLLKRGQVSMTPNRTAGVVYRGYENMYYSKKIK